MPKQIIWSPLAENDFANILDYLDKNWDRKVASNFIDLTKIL
jgi:plasmid stabilization system protein ParE